MGTKVNVQTALPTDVAVNGTFTVQYPSGYTQATLIGSFGGQVRVNDNDVFQQGIGAQFTFGASVITVTNISSIVWPLGSYLQIGFDTTSRNGSYNLTLGTERNQASPAQGGGGGTLPLGLPASVASLVSIGDSFTAGTGASDAAHQWVNIAAASLSATLTNNAIAGTVLQNSPDETGNPKTSNGRDRYFAAMIGGTNKKELAIIPYGYNDARYTASPTTINVANYQNDLDEIVTDLLLNGYDPNRIVVVSPWYITDVGLTTGTSGFAGQKRAGFEAYVAAAAAVAAKYGVYYYDAYAYMRDNGGAALIGGDNIHPNNAGHAAIAAGFMLATRLPVATLPLPSFWLVDTFTDVDGTLLTAHVSDSGASWSLQTGYTPASGNVLTAGSMWGPSGTGIYKTSVAPPSADYAVRAYMIYLTNVGNDNVGVIGRADTGANTFYFFRLNKSVGAFQLFKTVGGTTTQLGSDVAAGAFVGIRSIELRMIGSLISGWVDNVKIIEVTDSAIAAAGRAGVRMGNVQTATTGIHIDKITALAV